MALRFRHFRGIEKLSPLQIVLAVLIAVLCVVLMVFLDKKKPEWKGRKNKVITIAAAAVLIGITIFAL